MNELVYPRERTLGAITLVLGLLFWFLLIVGSFGIALLVLALGFVLYLFAQSMLIAHIKGNGVELSATQFPELFEQFNACCDRLEMRIRPQAYIINGNGGLNAFATKFLGTQFVVLNSDVVDAMDKHIDGVRFYIGHELGHLRMKHLNGHLLRWPALWLPLLGAAYSRARESTCDRHGLACSSSGDGAARALAALSAGSKRWQQLDMESYVRQASHTRGFWMSFHELTEGYPWLTKRAARVMDTGAAMPPRNVFAYFLALFVPYAGRLGAGFAMFIIVYIGAVLAAVAIPAYSDYKAKAQIASAMMESQPARTALASYFDDKQDIPDSLESIGQPSLLASGTQLTLEPETMVLSVTAKTGETIVYSPEKDAQGQITWTCAGGEGMKVSLVPKECQ